MVGLAFVQSNLQLEQNLTSTRFAGSNEPQLGKRAFPQPYTNRTECKERKEEKKSVPIARLSAPPVPVSPTPCEKK